jgi:mannose-1-phosphate guanylyltransferase
MMALPRKAMLLCAGLGTRLRPLTEHLPKPAVPLCGVPPVRWNLAMLAAAGVEEVVVNTHWRPEAIRAAVGDPAPLGLEVHFSHEPEILGTGGGLKAVARHFEDETFYLVNGKLLFDADLEGAVAFHRARQAVATMVLRPYPEGATYGAIEIDEAGLIRRFVGRFEHPGPLTRCMFTGVHVLEPRILDYLPEGEAVCVNAHGYVRMIEAGETVCGHLQPDRYFAEPSTPSRYLAAAMDLVDGKVPMARFRAGGVDPFAGFETPAPGLRIHPSATLAPEARLEGSVWVGPGAQVAAGAVVGPSVVIESGAAVGPGARVSRSVVWTDTVIGPKERLDGCVAADGERVVAAPGGTSGLQAE